MEESERYRQHYVVTASGNHFVENKEWKPSSLERSIPPPLPDASVWFHRYREMLAQPPRVRATLQVDKQHLALGDKACITLTLKNITTKGIRLYRGRGFNLDECDEFTRGGALRLYHRTMDFSLANTSLVHYVGRFFFCGTGTFL